jgi:hypothetical protein
MHNKSLSGQRSLSLIREVVSEYGVEFVRRFDDLCVLIGRE